MTTYTENELAEAIKTVDAAEGTGDIPAHSWARCAKILRAELAQLRNELDKKDNVHQNSIQTLVDDIEILRADNERIRQQAVDYALIVEQFQKLLGVYTTTSAFERIAEKDAALEEARTIKPDDLVAVANWSDFDTSDAIQVGKFSHFRDGHYYILESGRCWRYCRKVITLSAHPAPQEEK